MSIPIAARPTPSISINELKAHCRICSMRELCLPFGLAADELRQLNAAVTSRTRLKKNDTLYRAGDAFSALYAIRVGSCKTTILAEDGREQITGYHMLGDILGMDGIAGEQYVCAVTALENTEVCALPFDQLEQLGRTIPALQHNLHRFLSRGIARDQNMMLVLGSLHAEARLAVFLLNLSDRYRQRGYSPVDFELRMTREEIGSYLGLKLETVSRSFSRFQERGLLQVQARSVKLFGLAALKQVASIPC